MAGAFSRDGRASADPERILIIRPSALGDVCRSVPVLVSLRRRYPNAVIDWLVQDSFVDAIRTHPDLDGVVPFARRAVAIGRLWRPSAARRLMGLFGRLRDGRYDLVVDCQGLSRSGLFALVTGAPRRIGYRNAAELGWLALTDRVAAPVSWHTVDRMLALAEAVGAPAVRDLRLYTPGEGETEAERLAGDQRFVVLAPTSRWEGKRWPADRFERLARVLLDRGEVERLVVVGGAGERDQCAGLIELARSDARVVDAVGSTSVAGLMGLIERAALVVANDSAALHLGVGFDRPIVGLYGPTDVSRVGPYGRERDVVRPADVPADVSHKDREAGRRIMERITFEEVEAACMERLRDSRRRADAGIADTASPV